MKVSELIDLLKQQLDEHGDVKVMVQGYYYNYVTGVDVAECSNNLVIS